jgi:DNA-directed RNA polymerase specialized sigma24 family protein
LDIRLNSDEDYELLYRRYSGMLHGIICGCIKDLKAAEAVLEQSFKKIYEDINSRNTDVSFATWAIQQALAVIREHQAQKRIANTPDGSCIFTLMIQGFTANEIATMLNLPLETVRKQLRTDMKEKTSRK